MSKQQIRTSSMKVGVQVALRYRNGERVSESVNLLTSLLVRYPEVASLNYEPEGQVLRFTFMFSPSLARDVVEGFGAKVRACLETCDFLQEITPRVVSINYDTCETVGILEVQRDVQTLCREEISLLIFLIREQFSAELIAEASEEASLDGEDGFPEEELIENMLATFKGAGGEGKLIAFREQGRVLVFNKQEAIEGS